MKYRERGNTARFVNAGRIKKTVLTLLTESIFVDLLLRHSIFWQIIGMMQFPFSVWWWSWWQCKAHGKMCLYATHWSSCSWCSFWLSDKTSDALKKLQKCREWNALILGKEVFKLRWNKKWDYWGMCWPICTLVRLTNMHHNYWQICNDNYNFS